MTPEGAMRLALGLARRASGRTFPNPPVGAVVFRGRRVLGRGWTRPAGGPHAEVVAIDAARRRHGDAALRGAWLAVTPEPCSHVGRTAPCADLVAGVGITRVFVGDKLDALNQYGSEPFNGVVENLLFQLLADPTNAIPLKFTTYLARAKYAAELGEKSKWLGSSKLGTIRDFVKVDEATLNLRRDLKKLLGAKADGASAKKLTEELLAAVAGIKSKDEMAKAIRAKLVAAGIDPRQVNDAQLFSLVESAITSRLRHEGIDYTTQAEDIRRQRAAYMLARRSARRRVASSRRCASSARRLASRRARRHRWMPSSGFGRRAASTSRS